MLLETFLFAIGFNILMFLPAFIFKTDKLTDMSYSLTFIFLATYLFISKPSSLGMTLLFLMVLIWALRLGIFLFIRIHKQKKDDRFDSMRNSFFKFLRFWLLQGFAAWIIILPLILFQEKFYVIGLIIWLIGLIIESVADYQKYSFKNKATNKNKYINTGLWAYSRHPNYFGEMLCWIGLFVFSGTWLLGILSPLFIIILLLFVSGIPLLEKKADEKWGHLDSYKKYKKETSLLIPWFKKK